MIRSPDTHDEDVTGRQDDRSRDVDVPESQIDQILADSFPASDAPPWTLGVKAAPRESTETPKRRRE